MIRPRGERRGCFSQFAGCLTVIAVCIGALYAFDVYLVAPWAHGDGPLLTRTWIGQFHTPEGRSGALELTLYHTWDQGRRRYSWDRRGHGTLGGTARSCGLASWPRYDLTGSASRSGDDVIIVIAPPRPAPAGLYLHELRGSWSGDSLRLSGVLATYAGTTSTYHGGAPDENQPTHFTLHPGSDADFDKLCGK
ncbi:MAG TPA: hypothetical protein VFA43_03140 [Gemmatimonadaceae bacterium]|nr:hypothetical protein [Gemmatimonadaceae bacterium]